ncbi:MAG TPA: hypothetical protein VH760_02465 [Gaiellaceae bacterium]|jgi:hypothetical protein
MGSWYWIGVAAGLGLAAGVAIGALIPQGRRGVTVGLAALLAVAAGLGIGLLVGDWPEAAAGAIGGVLGAVASALIVSGALRGGGTRLGLAVLVVVAALGLAALAFAPAIGYVEAVVVPLFAARASRRGSGRYAGLRILAKD